MDLTTIIQSKKGNSLTKYPSIMTYHKMGKGILEEKINMPEQDRDQIVYISEKIDGINMRILILNGDYVIGSREEFIYAKGDRIVSTNIKDYIGYMVSIAEDMIHSNAIKRDVLYCIYGELYGSKIQSAWKRYTSSKGTYGYRIFDVWDMPVLDFAMMYDSIASSEAASNWRESNRQPWYEFFSLLTFATSVISLSPVPYIKHDFLKNIPEDKEGAFLYLLNFQKTIINLDGSKKNCTDAEGIVIRTENREYISKLRFADYAKTFRKTDIKKYNELMMKKKEEVKK
ncbi:RNA ligase family protein [[Clostridium] innocuum]|nr:RNA ligase family protein [[Clostridium] innocuum]